MLAFIDESGDSGLKLESGSSRFFTITMVVFEDDEDALACERRIDLLRKELGWKPDSEFHFKMNSNKIREKFLMTVASCDFYYYGVVIRKDLHDPLIQGLANKDDFYQYACGLVFENAKHDLHDAAVVIDRTGNLDFGNKLRQYLRHKMNRDSKVIKRVNLQRSESNNLLQLADYVAGAINRSMVGNSKAKDSFRKLIVRHEENVDVWPN